MVLYQRLLFTGFLNDFDVYATYRCRRFEEIPVKYKETLFTVNENDGPLEYVQTEAPEQNTDKPGPRGVQASDFGPAPKDGKSFRCDKCMKIWKNRKCWKDHKSTPGKCAGRPEPRWFKIIKGKDYICTHPECLLPGQISGPIFSHKSKYFAHVKAKHMYPDYLVFPCPDCGDRFPFYDMLKYHERAIHIKPVSTMLEWNLNELLKWCYFYSMSAITVVPPLDLHHGLPPTR